MSAPSLPEFERAIRLSQGNLDAAELAECHGLLCGLLCRETSDTSSDYLEHLVAMRLVVNPGAALVSVLTEAFESTLRQLEDEEFGLVLWLPDDDESLEERTIALARWCSGFLAGLENMQTEYLLTLPCDGPVIVGDLAQRLATALSEADADIAVAHDGDRLQPVYALLHRRVLPGLRLALEQGERKIDRWYPQNHWVTVDFSDVPEQFSNINTPEDYASAGLSS